MVGERPNRPFDRNHSKPKGIMKMRISIKSAVSATVASSLVLLLGACSTGSNFNSAPGAVRGQDVQPGQNQQVEMTPEQAAAAVNEGNAGMVGGNAEVAGKPDMSQQGAMPAGVGYGGSGILFDPATGNHTYVHHVIHHVHHDAASAAAAGLNTAPPSGYQKGTYEVPDNENPAMRGWSRLPAYNMGAQHIYQAGANVVHHHYYGPPAPGQIGHWNPNANDGAGSIEGFDD